MVLGIIIGILIMSTFATIGMVLWAYEKDAIGTIFGGPIAWALLLILHIINNIYRANRRKKTMKQLKYLKDNEPFKSLQ